MFKRSLFLSVVMTSGITFYAIAADDADDAVAIISEAATEVVAEGVPTVSSPSRVTALCSYCTPSVHFIKRMINPYSYINTAKAMWHVGWRHAAQRFWSDKAVVTGSVLATLIAAGLIAEYYYDNLISKSFKKAKKPVINHSN